MKINMENEKAVASAFAEVEKRARVRTVSYVRAQHYVAKVACRLIELKVKAKELVGMKFRINPYCTRFPGSYRGIPEGTCFEFEAFPTGWFLTKVYRGRCNGSVNLKVQFLNEEEYRKYFKFN